MTTVPTPVLGGTSSDQATIHSGQLSWGVSPSLRPEQSLPVFQRTCCLVCRKWKHLGVLPCPLWAAHCDRAAQAQAPGDSLSRVHARGEQVRPGLRGTPVWLGPYTPSGFLCHMASRTCRPVQAAQSVQGTGGQAWLRHCSSESTNKSHHGHSHKTWLLNKTSKHSQDTAQQSEGEPQPIPLASWHRSPPSIMGCWETRYTPPSQASLRGPCPEWQAPGHPGPHVGGDKQAAQCGHSPRRTLVSTGCYKGSQPAVTALAAAESPVETPSEVLHSRDLERANMSRSRLVSQHGARRGV